MGSGPTGPLPVPVVPLVPPVRVLEVVWVQAVLVHRVYCRRGMGALLTAAIRLRVGECTVRGVRWLLGVGRRWGKWLSSLVVYLDRPVVVHGHEILHLATLVVKPLGAQIRGAIYVVLPSMYSCQLRPSLAHLVPFTKSSYLFSLAFLSVPSCQLNVATVISN